MLAIYLTFATAVSISAVAAYFSIAGLVALFAATPIPIMVMGVTLEIAKLVTASWVYRNWLVAPTLIKYYFTAAVITLSIITSLGIFGYLSKSHIEQASLSNANLIELRVLEQQEKIVVSRIEFLVRQSEKTSSVVSTRINRELVQLQTQLKDIITKKSPLLQEQNNLNTKIGPIKYIAELVYGGSEEDLINKAVRLMIITLVLVFDPLAILLLIGANISLRSYNKPAIISDHIEIDENMINIDRSKIHEIKEKVSTNA